MEQLLTKALESGNATAIFCCGILYLIIHAQRSSTGKKRDEEAVLMKYRIEQLEKGSTEMVNSIKELQDSVIKLTIAINRFINEDKNARV